MTLCFHKGPFSNPYKPHKPCKPKTPSSPSAWKPWQELSNCRNPSAVLSSRIREISRGSRRVGGFSHGLHEARFPQPGVPLQMPQKYCHDRSCQQGTAEFGYLWCEGWQWAKGPHSSWKPDSEPFSAILSELLGSLPSARNPAAWPKLSAQVILGAALLSVRSYSSGFTSTPWVWRRSTFITEMACCCWDPGRVKSYCCTRNLYSIPLCRPSDETVELQHPLQDMQEPNRTRPCT